MNRHRTSKAAPIFGRSTNRLATRQRVAAEKVAKRKAKTTARRKRQADAAALGDAAPPVKIPRTLENTRVRDDDATRRVTAEEVAADAAADEFAPIYRGEVTPLVVVTTGMGAGKVASHAFASSLLEVVPNSEFLERCALTPTQVLHHAKSVGASDVLLIREDHKKLTSLTHVHLPAGPTAVWRLTSVVPPREIRGHGKALPGRPEVLLNNFSTTLGHRIGRMLGALFGGGVGVSGRARQVVTWHNQRDFVFFRFHRYIFQDGGERVGLQELGPRFTLRLDRLLRGAWGARGMAGLGSPAQRKEAHARARAQARARAARRAAGGGSSSSSSSSDEEEDVEESDEEDEEGVEQANASDEEEEPVGPSDADAGASVDADGDGDGDGDSDGDDSDSDSDSGDDSGSNGKAHGNARRRGHNATGVTRPPPPGGAVGGGTPAAAAASAAPSKPRKSRHRRDPGVEWVRNIRAEKDRRKFFL
ncbi:hypothetical protein MMPV_002250 [Pyropia vietnamensis]